jgi:hypothetical protein
LKTGLPLKFLKQLVENGKDLGISISGGLKKCLPEKIRGKSVGFQPGRDLLCLSYGIFNSNFIRAKPQHTLSLPLWGGRPWQMAPFKPVR